MSSRRLYLMMLGSGLVLAEPWACSSSSTPVSGTGGDLPTPNPIGSSSAGSGGGAPGNVGLACTADADCGTGLLCSVPSVTDSVFGGGPAGGYCSTGCAENVDCPSDSICLTTASGPGDCVLTCTLGPALTTLDDPLSADTCRGRADLACVGLTGGGAVCLPTCGEDSQCPASRVCDPRLSVCVTTPSTGLAAGAMCNPTAATPDCEGICVSFSGSDVTLCSEGCVLGGDPTTSSNCGGIDSGVCLYAPPGNGAGDYGFCSTACAKQDDCQNPAFWCDPVFGVTGVGGVTNGYCSLGTPCPNGASDCSSEATATCTETQYGPFCVYSQFPLGSAAPGDGGTGDGG
jgi:hypothetical protein